MNYIKKYKFNIYALIEILLILAMLVFQVLIIAKISTKESISIPNNIIRMSLTSITFIFSLFTFFSKKNKDKFDIFSVYFLLLIGADIIFTFMEENTGAHFLFLIAYILFMLIRGAKWYQYLMVMILGLVFTLVIIILGKFSVKLLIDAFLGTTLALNVIFTWISFKKTKTKLFLILSIAVSFILLSDASIFLSAIFKNNETLANIINLFIWPTYITGNILFNYSYLKHDLLNN